MRATLANGQALCFSDERLGDGGPQDAPALVFTNSLGTDLRVWDPLLPCLPAGLRILRFDQRGHGLSDCPPGPYTIEALADDLEALLEARGVGRAVIVGLSVGGMIAQAFAARRPDKVAALVLCDTAHKIGTAEMWQTRIDGLMKGGIVSLAEPILERWFCPAFRKERPAELAIWRNMLVRTPLEGYVATCAAIRDADLTASAAGLTMPALCLAGAEDGATPPALVRELAGLLPDARFAVIPAAGHLPSVEQPEALGSLIAEFLKERKLAG
ncbi:3-oxoadipate enol-lactonase [Tistlia consotensis]|uniref:3-oxoadipate enol-lactonase n=1 Tax=Tistlia consotensis USBA 355 TaxID=560819 RepID=A0A1Y6CM76_9PROT|nr:3-oxoadipate enol-lactonase [Tistlia consotensis]SMF77254.1 3-oxoadipate enol-lactonase [Tistlia consotensis USBA 355]SNS14562.1 3-oxoadipate enol-lactonase [Tistlia consotensis]